MSVIVGFLNTLGCMLLLEVFKAELGDNELHNKLLSRLT